MLDRLSLPVINRLLRDDPWAMQRLAAFAGATIHLNLRGTDATANAAPWTLSYRIKADGLLATAQTTDEAEATLSIELPADAASRFISQGRHGVISAAKVRGNVELANTISEVIDNLRPDPEAFLASKIGDIAAHRAVGLFDTLRHGIANLASRLKDQFNEHVAEGHSVIVPNADLVEFSNNVDRLRDDVARLQQRVERLATH